MKVKAYEGKEKFIFVSYAHKDSEQVLRIIKMMQEQGYRVWYDEGIAPGSEWPENIAQHLNASEVVIAFISANSLASANCRSEITFAFSKNKPFLGIVMERAEMSPGMEMQLAARQCIFRYNYSEEQDFLGKIMTCPDLVPCKGEESLVDQVTQQPESEPQATKEAVAQTITAPINNHVTAPAPQTPLHKPVKEKKSFADIIKSKAFMISASATLLVLGLLIALVSYNRVKLTDEQTVSRGETYLTLKDETITPQLIEQINKLEKLWYLEFQNCTFEEDAFDGWKNHEKLTSFTVNGTDTLKDYSFLQSQTGLERLTLKACGVTDENFSVTELKQLVRVELSDNPEFTDLSLLNYESLAGLDISGTGVEDLSPLEGCKLKTLDFSGTEVTDVTAVGTILTLVTLDGSGTEITDIAPVAGLQNLTEIYFNDCQIQNITEKIMSLKMEKIGFANNGLQECSGFEYFTTLTEVDLSGNQLRNVDFLEKSAGSLKVLAISGNDLDETEVEFLTHCASMEKLYVNDIMLANLNFVSNMTDLNTIHAINCGITDISALANSANLEVVRLAYNDITDLSGLQNLKFAYSTIVDLAYNQVTDITALPEGSYKWLILLGNNVLYANGGFAGVTGDHIVLEYHEDLLKGEMADDIFYSYVLVDCPADKQLETQKTLGQYNTFFMTEEEAFAYLQEENLDYSQWLNQ